MRKTVITILVTIILILSIPVSLLGIGFGVPAQFDETYYGQLSFMFKRLKNTEGKKVILIGNSSVAFGVRSDLLQDELQGYTVVNFGLYGAIGTKAMLDLSKVNIGKDDIIVVMPEPVKQSYSMYFSGKDMWRAADGNYEILKYIPNDNAGSMAGNFISFASEKYQYKNSGSKPHASGVYSQAAFNLDGNEVGYMTCNRPYNIMFGGYDPTIKANYNMSVIDDDFIDYLNDYNKFAVSCSATVYLGFPPVNTLAVAEGEKEKADDLCNYLHQKLDFEILGHPWRYMLDYEWFYDNNVHMNSAGMFLYTNLLANDLKIIISDYTPVKIPVPEKPQIPVGAVVTGDNRDAEYFVYELSDDNIGGEYVVLTGLTDEGKNRSTLTIPSDYDGIPVKTLNQSVFTDNTVISEITVPKSIGAIYDNSFDGCVKLTKLIFEHNSILDISVGVAFLAGADNSYLYLKKNMNVDTCFGGWETYRNRIILY